MTKITFDGDRVVMRDGERIGSDQSCCCDGEEGEPCCPCEGGVPPEECGLQSITISLDFAKLGTCYPDGVAATFSVTAADDDWRGTGSWNKRYTISGDNGDVNFETALSCEGGVGPEGANCWAILLNVQGVGCTLCFTNVIGYVIRLSGITQDGVCCPAGRNRSLPPPPFCTDVEGTIAVTCVY